MTFLEAPRSESEMRRYCKEVDGPKLANMLEGGLTPILSPAKLKEIGYTGISIILRLHFVVSLSKKKIFCA